MPSKNETLRRDRTRQIGQKPSFGQQNRSEVIAQLRDELLRAQQQLAVETDEKTRARLQQIISNLQQYGCQ